MMASDAEKVRKDLVKRGYRVEAPTKRGGSSYMVIDPKTEKMVARFPVSPRPGSWSANLEAAIRRYERTGQAARSGRFHD